MDKSPYQEDKDAVIISEGEVPKLMSESKVMRSLFKGKFQRILTIVIDEKEPSQDVKMEEVKENQPVGQPKMKINNEFLNILKEEIPNLKVSNYSITKNDLKNQSEEEQNESAASINNKVNNGFYNILGLSKREIHDMD